MRVAVVLALGLSVAACGNQTSTSSTGIEPASTIPSVSTSAPMAGASTSSDDCDLAPTDNDLIIWQHWPRLPNNALLVGDVDMGQCKPTLDTWRAMEPTGPGYCNKIAWASDNPGYDVDQKPAPPLRKVLDEYGDDC